MRELGIEVMIGMRGAAERSDFIVCFCIVAEESVRFEMRGHGGAIALVTSASIRLLGIGNHCVGDAGYHGIGRDGCRGLSQGDWGVATMMVFLSRQATGVRGWGRS